MLDWLFQNSKQEVQEAAQSAATIGYFDSLLGSINHFVLVFVISFIILITVTRGSGGAWLNIILALCISYLWQFWIFK
jgi:hypothetical protein